MTFLGMSPMRRSSSNPQQQQWRLRPRSVSNEENEQPQPSQSQSPYPRHRDGCATDSDPERTPDPSVSRRTGGFVVNDHQRTIRNMSSDHDDDVTVQDCSIYTDQCKIPVAAQTTYSEATTVVIRPGARPQSPLDDLCDIQPRIDSHKHNVKQGFASASSSSPSRNSTSSSNHQDAESSMHLLPEMACCVYRGCDATISEQRNSLQFDAPAVRTRNAARIGLSSSSNLHEPILEECDSSDSLTVVESTPVRNNTSHQSQQFLSWSQVAASVGTHTTRSTVTTRSPSGGSRSRNTTLDDSNNTNRPTTDSSINNPNLSSLRYSKGSSISTILSRESSRVFRYGGTGENLIRTGRTNSMNSATGGSNSGLNRTSNQHTNSRVSSTSSLPSSLRPASGTRLSSRSNPYHSSSQSLSSRSRPVDLDDENYDDYDEEHQLSSALRVHGGSYDRRTGMPGGNRRMEDESDDSTLDSNFDLGSRINMTDATLMDERSSSPGALRLTSEGLQRHERKTLHRWLQEQQQHRKSSQQVAAVSPEEQLEAWRREQQTKKWLRQRHAEKHQELRDQNQRLRASILQREAQQQQHQQQHKTKTPGRISSFGPPPPPVDVETPRSQRSNLMEKLVAPFRKEEDVAEMSLAPLNALTEDLNLLKPVREEPIRKKNGANGGGSVGGSATGVAKTKNRLLRMLFPGKKHDTSAAARELLEKERRMAREARARRKLYERKEMERIERKRQEYLDEQRRREAFAANVELPQSPSNSERHSIMSSIEVIPEPGNSFPSISYINRNSRRHRHRRDEYAHEVSTISDSVVSMPSPDKAAGGSGSSIVSTAVTAPMATMTTMMMPLCVVCGQNERTHIAAPCMHFCFCEPCAATLSKQNTKAPCCPVCSEQHVTFVAVSV